MTSTEEKALAARYAAWKLSHQAPEDYSQRLQAEMTGPDGGPLQVTAKMAIQRLRALAEDDDDADA